MATGSITVFEGPRKVCADVLKRLEMWEERYQRLEERQNELAQLPMTEASLYWHLEEYLYLIHPTKDGYRPRKYIGNRPEKVQAAADAVERFNKHKAIGKEIRRLQNQLVEAQFGLQQCLHTLEDRDYHDGLL